MSHKIKQHGPIQNLADYLRVIQNIRERWPQPQKPKVRGDERGLWFRGQHSAEYGLSPKLHWPAFSEADEKEIRQEFQSRALQLIQGRLPQTELEWYFLMQHYGVPTRLLDWTDNPLIALFFAVEKNYLHRDAAVWVIDPWWLNKANKEVRKRKIEGPMLPDWEEASLYLRNLEDAFAGKRVRMKFPAAIEPPHIDRRLAVQGSRFLIFGTRKDLTQQDELLSGADTRLIKMLIPVRSIPIIRGELENCGITVGTVFPDLIALGEDIKRRWCKNDQA